MAAHGYPSLALAYFKAPGLPQSLHNLPLEYFTSALKLLRAQPEVDSRHVLVAGESRGRRSRAAARRPLPQAGQRRHRRRAQLGGESRLARRQPSGLDAGRSRPSGREPVGARAAQPAGKAPAVIPVERIRGPILLTCGELDMVWPSCGYVDAITARLRAHGSASPVTTLRYRDAGHLVGGLTAYYGSLTDEPLTSTGGTVAGTQADAHAKLLTLLASQ